MSRLNLAVFVLAFAAVSLPAAAVAGKLAPQSSSQAGVTVKVTPRSLQAPTWEFEVSFDTHSQDLNDDPAKSATLVADGKRKFSPSGWQGDLPGGHHRKGVLSFAAVTPAPSSIELQLQRPGEAAPRVLRWQLK